VWVDLSLTALLWSLGALHTGRFIRPRWKLPGKAVFYLTVSALLSYYAGHISLIFVIGHPTVGLLFHIRACRQNDIDWFTCEPSDRYQALHDAWAAGQSSSAAPASSKSRNA